MPGKAGRRGHNEGAIYQRSDGRWVGAVHLGWEGGKRRRKVVYGKTRAEVSQKVTRLLAEREKGSPIQTADKSVAAFLDEWLAQVVKPTRAANTYTSYRTAVETHIKPAIGKHQLSKLTQQHVQGMLNTLTVSPATVGLVRSILRAALNQALRWDLVSRNVAALATPPKKERFEGYALSPDQIRALMAAVAGEDLEALYAIASSVGLRQAELLGLRWRDVDRDTGTVTVRYQLQRGAGAPTFVELKTRSSRRTITLPSSVQSILRAHYRRQLERRLQAGGAWRDNDLVFCDAHGNHLHPEEVRRHWIAAKERAGIPEHVRFHDLRHSALTILASRGVPLRTLMGIAGHSTIAVTMQIYAHLDADSVRESIELMSDLYGGESGVS
jgi:integrase